MRPEEYLERDQRDPWKNEYLDGRMVAMPHPNITHLRITTQIGTELHPQLKETSFWVAMARLRLHVPSAHYYTFPDLMILREPGHYEGSGEVVSALDPVVILEVFSPETEANDRGERYARYRQIASLSDYLLIAQDEPHIEHFIRQDDGTWKQEIYRGLEANVTIASVGCSLCLASVYDRRGWT